MFGLMRSCSCNKSPEQRELQRLHYCGTCKTMGRLYGQKSRALLNYDAVFLGEVLTALEARSPQFAAAYVSRNCFAVPRAEQMPWALQYAATANVVLAQFKISDHVQDTGSRLYRLLGRLFRPQFRRASRLLSDGRFPLDELNLLMAMQVQRERESAPTLERLAEPTARATQLMFRHGALKTGSGMDVVETMSSLGAVFGEIAYLVDALQDRAADAKKGAFNALAATATTDEDAKTLLRAKQREMLDNIHALPIDEGQKAIFAARLRTNLAPVLLSGSVIQMGRRWTRSNSPPDSSYRVPRESRCCQCGNNAGDCCCASMNCCDAGCCMCEICNCISCCSGN